MSFVPVLDRSQNGMFLVSCEGCGVGLDWLTGVELTSMAIKGYRHFCFDCDKLEADRIPRCFDPVDGQDVGFIQLWLPDGTVVELARPLGVSGEETLVLFSQNSKDCTCKGGGDSENS